ncbi:hypothetical protein JFQ72_004406 [Vibrio parahaemolyticus]|nr:hypothetical protein [Vibrio parahaemolyticus]
MKFEHSSFPIRAVAFVVVLMVIAVVVGYFATHYMFLDSDRASALSGIVCGCIAKFLLTILNIN